MPALHELQVAFAGALAGDSNGIAAHLSPGALSVAQRLGIYRNNVAETFHSTLVSAYPVLQRLVGEQYFRQLAAAYCATVPSRSGNLFDLGRGLPDFLAMRYDAGDYVYFADVARLEWACQLALVAADHGPLDIARLAVVEAQRYSSLRFRLHPSAALLRSDYPLLKIWQQNLAGAEEPADDIDLASGGDALLIRRCAGTAEVRSLDEASYAFLLALSRRQRLSGAYINASIVDENFDLSANLNRWVSRHVIVDFD